MLRFIFSCILAALLLVNGSVGLAANTSTTTLTISTNGGTVTGKTVAIDTVDADLTILTPAAGKMACLVGGLWSNAAPGTLTMKSGSTTAVALSLSSYQGVLSGISPQPILCTNKGEALVIRSSVAMPSLLLYVTETSSLDLNFSGR